MKALAKLKGCPLTVEVEHEGRAYKVVAHTKTATAYERDAAGKWVRIWRGNAAALKALSLCLRFAGEFPKRMVR